MSGPVGALGLSRQQRVRIHHELFRRTLVEVDITFWSVVEPDHGYVYCLCNLNLVMENRLHQLAVVLQNRCLTRVE
jgi:hypothetical protein